MSRKDPKVIGPDKFYPTAVAEIVLFDLRYADAANRLHRERARWQGRSDLEALDEHRFVLVVAPDGEQRPRIFAVEGRV